MTPGLGDRAGIDRDELLARRRVAEPLEELLTTGRVVDRNGEVAFVDREAHDHARQPEAVVAVEVADADPRSPPPPTSRPGRNGVAYPHRGRRAAHGRPIGAGIRCGCDRRSAPGPPSRGSRVRGSPLLVSMPIALWPWRSCLLVIAIVSRPDRRGPRVPGPESQCRDTGSPVTDTRRRGAPLHVDRPLAPSAPMSTTASPSGRSSSGACRSRRGSVGRSVTRPRGTSGSSPSSDRTTSSGARRRPGLRRARCRIRHRDRDVRAIEPTEQLGEATTRECRRLRAARGRAAGPRRHSRTGRARRSRSRCRGATPNRSGTTAD